MSTASIKVDHLARVEGHGNVHVVIEDGAVQTVEMNVIEPARLFESMVRGRSYTEVSYIASRVCGICSASHVVTSLLAIERIFGVEVADRTKALRELLVYGSYLQNHATHLFVLAAPDFLNQPSVFPLAQSDPALFDKALGLKALGNELCTKVGGRSIHPVSRTRSRARNTSSLQTSSRRPSRSRCRPSTCSIRSARLISRPRATSLP